MQSPEYLNATVWCRLGPSPIHGIGVFAIRDIPAGMKITDYRYDNISGHGDFKGENDACFYLMAEKQFERVHPEIRKLVMDRMLWDASQKMLKFVSPNHDQFLQSFMNHAEDPNTDECVALRDIQKGEELTEDFRGLFDTPHPLTKAHHSFLYGSRTKRKEAAR